MNNTPQVRFRVDIQLIVEQNCNQISFIRWYSNLANYVISAERIKQFMCIPPEPPAIVEDNRPPSSWPTKGRIELLDLKVA